MILKRMREGNQLVQVLEVMSNGEMGPKATMTLDQLVANIHADVVKLDESSGGGVPASASGQSGALRNVRSHGIPLR
jgi:hypothetical protein